MGEYPLTRVSKDSKSLAKTGAFHTDLTDDGILLITLAGPDYRSSIQALRQAAAQIPKARGIVFDLRAPIYHSLVFAQSGVDNKLSSTPVIAPGTRTRFHNGYASEDRSLYPGYHSAFASNCRPSDRRFLHTASVLRMLDIGCWRPFKSGVYSTTSSHTRI